ESYNTNREIQPTRLFQALLPQHGIIRVIDQTEQEQVPTLTKRRIFQEVPIRYSDREMTRIIKNKSGPPVAVVLKPIIWENGEVYTLQVANYLFTVEETMRTLLYVLLAASIIMLVPSIVGAHFLSRFILRPIQQLIEAMQENTKKEK